MKILDESTKFAHLGKPGSAFSKGFQRRMLILEKFVDFKDKTILDLGCGEGVWLGAFTSFTNPENVYGAEYDKELVEEIINENHEIRSIFKIPANNIVNCPGEALTFENNKFDIIFQNEVLEHVQDDVKTISECFRTLKQGGKIVLFTPNRLWPFEQHGMFLSGKYIWGNIPFLPWTPRFIYKIFAPHVRNYWPWELRNVIKNGYKDFAKDSNDAKGYRITTHTQVFPGFDGAVRRFGIFGKIIQKIFLVIEKTPLKVFGISHLLIVEKL